MVYAIAMPLSSGLPAFVQMHGLGNRFALVDARHAAWRPSIDAVQKLARETASDQILALEPSDSADVFLRIWNADGSEVAACGNGTRCAAWHLMQASGQDRVRIETLAGRLQASRAGDLSVTVDMGRPRFEWADIPLAERMDTRHLDIKIGPIDAPILAFPSAVNMGNPHCVFFVSDAETAPVAQIGPMIEHHALFPEATNVGFAEIRDAHTIRLRVWERGVGVTQACGTGACAAAVAAARLKRCARQVTVLLDGGALGITWRLDDGHVLMTGPVAYV